MTNKISFEPWTPEKSDGPLVEGPESIVCELDPRVVTNHQIGQLPVPPNPPPPVGWEYWGKQPIPPVAAKFANALLFGMHAYPMGTFARIFTQGEVIGARVEWHNFQGATGKKGCFRGVNLLKKVPC